MIDKEKDIVDISTLAGVSLSITEVRFELSKQQFWNLVRLRHGWENAIYQHLVISVENVIFSTV